MKRILLALVFISATAIANTGASVLAGEYPMGPNPEMTPGSLCSTPDSYRYPERIRYCTRNVSRDEKQEIIRVYDVRFGYQIGSMDRADFKIDHLIPLCMGGSNEMDNLWPQHKSVYELTDSLEELSCKKMAEGRLRQSRAVELILRAKHNLKEVRSVYNLLMNL